MKIYITMKNYKTCINIKKNRTRSQAPEVHTQVFLKHSVTAPGRRNIKTISCFLLLA